MGWNVEKCIFEVDEPVTIDMMLEVLESIKAQHGGDVVCINIERNPEDDDCNINSIFYNAGGTVSIL